MRGDWVRGMSQGRRVGLQRALAPEQRRECRVVMCSWFNERRPRCERVRREAEDGMLMCRFFWGQLASPKKTRYHLLGTCFNQCTRTANNSVCSRCENIQRAILGPRGPTGLCRKDEGPCEGMMQLFVISENIEPWAVGGRRQRAASLCKLEASGVCWGPSGASGRLSPPNPVACRLPAQPAR